MTDPTAPYAGFGGRVGRTVAGSESWWPERPTPPDGAPNVVVMLADDLGFSDLGCYGSEIATPNLDRMAEEGVRYTNFHVTPMCSPTRASLLTGLNSHAAGVGHVAHSDSGFPGYAMELADDAATVAEILGDQGYATFMVGKWHLAKDSDCSAAGPRHSWPCQRGFERFYGILDGFTNLHHPHQLIEDNHAVEVDRYPDGYYFTDDLTDRAISMIREIKASNPSQPFFLYFAHGAVHAPLHAKPDDIAAYADTYHGGWDRLRETRFDRLRELGIVGEDVRLPPRNSEPGNEVPAWDELSDKERELYARYMAIYAAMLHNIDENVGRLRDALAEMGELDNTVILFTSDNGASREGEEQGTSSYFVQLISKEDHLDDDHARLSLMGGPQTTPHVPRGWAMASNTPFRLYKINTHAGGHHVPAIVSWPERLRETGGLRDQYVHVTDVVPTLLELIGVEAPTERHGRPLKPMAGTSFAASLDDPAAPTVHTEQYYEMVGHRGFYRDGWEAVTLHQPLTPFTDAEWELYHLDEDPTETEDLAARHPERVRELADAWEEAAWANQVYPLDEGSMVKFMIRPERSLVYEQPVTIQRGTPGLERWRSQQLVYVRSFEVAVTLDFAAGDRGTLVSHGDQGGGYGLNVVDDDELVWIHNDGRGHVQRLSGGRLSPGAKEVGASVAAPGRNTWRVVLRVDGRDVSEVEEVPVLFPMAPFQGIDVGIDRKSPVSWEIYEGHGPFPFTGDLRSVTYTPGEPAPDSPAEMVEVLREMGRRFE